MNTFTQYLDRVQCVQMWGACPPVCAGSCTPPRHCTNISRSPPLYGVGLVSVCDTFDRFNYPWRCPLACSRVVSLGFVLALRASELSLFARLVLLGSLYPLRSRAPNMPLSVRLRAPLLFCGINFRGLFCFTSFCDFTKTRCIIIFRGVVAFKR